MEDDLEADSLDELFESLVPLDDLLHEIRRCIISEEEISDDASSTLKHIRRAMKQTNQKIHTQLTLYPIRINYRMRSLQCEMGVTAYQSSKSTEVHSKV